MQFASDEVEEKIVVPVWFPGDNHQQNAYFKTNQDIDDDGYFG